MSDIPLLRPALIELEELRRVALEERIDADLALGRAAEVVGELETLVGKEPLRERPRAQLMLALYRSGRHAEALDVYQRTRAMLVDELGIEPSASLQELQRSILRQDPALDLSVPKDIVREGAISSKVQTEASASRPRGPSIRMAIVAAAVFVLVAAAAAVFTRQKNGRPLRLAADAVGILKQGRLVGQAAMGTVPGAVAADRGAVWVVNTAGGSVARLDQWALVVRQTIPVGSGPNAIAIGNGDVWVVNGLDGTVSRIDPKAEEVVQTITVGNSPSAIAYGLGAVWVANRSDQTLSRIDSRTGHVLETSTTEADATAIATGAGFVWVTDHGRGRVVRFDPTQSAPVQTISVGSGPSAIVFAAGSLWVANALDSTVSRVDPPSNRVIATVPVGAGPNSLAAAPDGLWVGNGLDGTASRIDSKTNRVDRTVELGQRPEGMTASLDAAFVSVGPSRASHRGGTLRLVATDFTGGSLDPRNNGIRAALTLTNDGLIAFRRVGGAQGTELVPDLATALPEPTDGGRTYTFRLRPGIHYSTGRIVTVQDIRRALERAVEFFGRGGYYDRILGASRCRRRGCDLSRGIVTNQAARMITFHLTAPDPDFLTKLALLYAYAVPASTPSGDLRSHPAPATGPYMISSYVPGKLLRLVRNPRFHTWSEEAQPDGFPSVIEWRLDVGPDAQVRAVETGRADFAFDGMPLNRFAEVQTQYPDQLVENPEPRTTYLFLNTRVPPFNDVRIRRAVSYAMDRAAVVRALGGLDRARPTCQLLPPNFPGYQPYCPFTLQPSRAGVWTAPDLKKAQQLVSASGRRGSTVTVWVGPKWRREAALAVAVLEQLGFHAHTKRLDSTYFSKVGDSRLKIQAGMLSWQADYPTASNFIRDLLSCGAFMPQTGLSLNASEFCDTGIDAQIERARTLQVTDPAIAVALWSTIDHEITDRAPIVPLVNPTHVDFYSQRVGNYQYNPRGVLLDQLWVR